MNSDAHRRVLVLDDDPGILSLLAARLGELPIHLVECSELEAAETLLDHMPFGVLIADLEVSELGGLEGMRLIRHAVTNFPATKVLIFSAHVTPHAYRLASSLGVTEVLEKPGDLSRLPTLINDLTTDPYSDHASGESSELTVIEPLEQILLDKDVTSVFQPIFELGVNGSPRKLFGIEALSRGPRGSLLQNPTILFAYAVRKELAFETDRLCIEGAVVASKGVPSNTKLFINSHPRALSHPDFVDTLIGLLETHEIERSRVVLELTEQSAIVDTVSLAAILDQIRQHGVKIALDDFGEGSSNLHLVHDLRPDYLKVTGRFCGSIENAPAKQALVKSAVGLSRDLGMKTIMERVESDEELEALKRLGIDYGQGFHLGRPQPARVLAASWPKVN